MLHILGCLDRPTAGRYVFEGRELRPASRRPSARCCVATASASSSSSSTCCPVCRPAATSSCPCCSPAWRGRSDARGRPALDAVGLAHRAGHRPDQLSGGERQRVAIARAVVMRPALLLADEPTGNLDRHSAAEVMELLEAMNEPGLTLIVVTHDPAIAERAGRVVVMSDGEIVGAGRPPAAARDTPPRPRTRREVPADTLRFAAGALTGHRLRTVALGDRCDGRDRCGDHADGARRGRQALRPAGVRDARHQPGRVVPRQDRDHRRGTRLAGFEKDLTLEDCRARPPGVGRCQERGPDVWRPPTRCAGAAGSRRAGDRDHRRARRRCGAMAVAAGAFLPRR